jgi:hypothetical protein
MRTTLHRSAQLGELVVGVFDEAAHYSTDPRRVSRLATLAVMHMLRPHLERRGTVDELGASRTDGTRGGMEFRAVG